MSRVLPYNAKQWEVPLLLDGRKTVTRQIIKYSCDDVYKSTCARGMWNEIYGQHVPKKLIRWYIKYIKKPPYQPGDISYVRETWDCLDGQKIGDIGNKNVFFYKADGDLRPISWRGRWRPSIHMPKEAARIWLKVLSVRVGRLKDITPDEIVKEGITGLNMEHMEVLDNHYDIPFAVLWDSTIKKSDIATYGWDANPWVWTIEFERCEKPGVLE